MSRVLKFRAWDRLTKKFLHPWPEGFHLFGETTCFDLIGQQLQPSTPDGVALMRFNDLDIMQFTGLLDQDGKEIYEGDILLPVTMHDGNRQFWRDDPPHGMKGLPQVIAWDADFAAFTFPDYATTDWTIIGNLHDHPNLLTAGQPP